jgi:hypothetical protein
MEFNSKNNKIGRRPKYATEEERAEAKRLNAKKYYEAHKDEYKKRQNQRYHTVKEENKQLKDMLKKYTETNCT